MGKSVQKLTDNVSLIASKESWIEGLAIQQLIKTSELPGMHTVAPFRCNQPAWPAIYD